MRAAAVKPGTVHPDRPPAGGKKLWQLRLYVAGATERSRQAVLRARQLCEVDLAGQYELQVIDVYQQPGLARDAQIVATPTLVREFPRPVRRFIGNLSNTAALLGGLELLTNAKAIG